MTEFNLKRERQKLFDIILKERPTAGRIYRIIRSQDEEFIRRLKEELKCDLTGCFSSQKQCDEFNQWTNFSIDKLAGDKLVDLEEEGK